MKKAFIKLKKNLLRLLPDKWYVVYSFWRNHNYFPTNLILNRFDTLNEYISLDKTKHEALKETISDKVKVRDYLIKKSFQDFLIKDFFVFDNVFELEDALSENDAFVLKTNHDSSGAYIHRVGDKIDLVKIRKRLEVQINNNHYHESREKQYEHIQPKIIKERLLLENNKIPNDYKFNVINNKVEFIYCSIDREGLNYRKIYDRNWNELDMTWTTFGGEGKFRGPSIQAPANLGKMIRLAEDLSSDFRYLRVDLYSCNGDIYIGELTLHHGSGLEPISPFSYDYTFGQLLKI